MGKLSNDWSAGRKIPTFTPLDDPPRLHHSNIVQSYASGSAKMQYSHGLNRKSGLQHVSTHTSVQHVATQSGHIAYPSQMQKRSYYTPMQQDLDEHKRNDYLPKPRDRTH